MNTTATHAAAPNPAMSARQFYASALGVLLDSGIPFLIGGAFALREYTGIERQTKDLDVFCKPSDSQRILQSMIDAGYRVEVKDPEWIAKVRHGDAYIDIIFSSRNRLCTVDNIWFEHARPAKLMEYDVLMVAPEEIIWTKVYVRERDRYDGADINHMILHRGESLDWQRLLNHMGTHTELFLSTLVEFSFVYPTERHKIPQWLLTECMTRVQREYELPPPQDKICRGTLLAYSQYEIDVKQWGYLS